MRVEAAWPCLRAGVSPRLRLVEHLDGQGTSCSCLLAGNHSSFAGDIRELMKEWLDMVWSDYRSASELVLGCICAFALRKSPLRYERRRTY